MRGGHITQGGFSATWVWEARITANHPLRRMRGLVDVVLRSMSKTFGVRYSHTGRPSCGAPEKLLRALLLQVLYTLRSERQLIEQLDYSLRCGETHPWPQTPYSGGYPGIAHDRRGDRRQHTRPRRCPLAVKPSTRWLQKITQDLGRWRL